MKYYKGECAAHKKIQLLPKCSKSLHVFCEPFIQNQFNKKLTSGCLPINPI